MSLTIKQYKAARQKLVVAKPKAMKMWPKQDCILEAVGGWGHNGLNFVWPSGDIGGSTWWVPDHTKSAADIARVFDASIADIDLQIEKLEGK